ncbi:Histone acetyltransferase type B subunit 2 [Glutinoglossum americanum]|uniref:Histone acetyltransferase type B subunit 2 n=1 Tax=Glutinoglossum americanum TaxID=1670608 RepID=A0A9P8I3M8_9PEZI|nr:Histone acetyltransferase type B subunit 2 [Glutinoglossum americanum]
MALNQGDVSAQEQDQEELTETKILNEEYKNWKKNAPFLYDLLLSTALDWPTLTAPQAAARVNSIRSPDKNYSINRLLLGTHTSNEGQNYIQIAHVHLPNSTAPSAGDYDGEREEIGGYGMSAGSAGNDVKFEIVQKIDHPGEINKARHMPKNPDMIATMCVDGKVMIWDRAKHSSHPTGTVNAQIELLGHSQEGFGLDWNPHQEGLLVTGSQDATNITLHPTRTYTHHTAYVNDVQHHPLHNSLIGTVSDDLTLQILDVRLPSTSTSVIQGKGHEDAVNALSFNPVSQYLLATASADKTIGIWDLRDLRFKLHSLEGHIGPVTSLSWHPFEEAVLGSASDDRRVCFWDLSKVGEEQTPDDQEDGPPELLFMHGGHINSISEFSWNKNDPWLICSAAEDNLLQVWKVANAIVGKDTDDVPTEELEQMEP